MSKLVYWVEYVKPIKYTDVLGKERELTGEYKCDHPLVDKAWYYGGGSVNATNSKIVCFLAFILKDGTRNQFEVKSMTDFEEAEKWLQSIENKK